MTGVRVGELCRVREEDLDLVAGTLRIVDRPEDAHLGDLKTGEGTVRFGQANPFLLPIDQWELYGRPVADRLASSPALKTACQSYFRNLRGGPLTPRSTRGLMERIYVGCGLWKEMRQFSPHIARHTIASLMLDAGVSLNAIQAFLRHQNIATTEQYARLSDPVIRDAMSRFFAGLAHLISDAGGADGVQEV
jgi:integrase